MQRFVKLSAFVMLFAITAPIVADACESGCSAGASQPSVINNTTTPTVNNNGGSQSNATSGANPTNNQTVNPYIQQAPSAGSTAVQVNNNYSGAFSFGPGITCQTPQIAINGYGQNQFGGGGPNVGLNGATVGLIIPLGGSTQRDCRALSSEIVKQRQLDTQFTLISKCVEFAKMGVTINPAIYPDLAKSCAGISPAVTVVQKTVYVAAPPVIKHLSNFAPKCKSITAARKVALLAALKADTRRHLSSAQLAEDSAYMTELQEACVPNREIVKGMDP